MTNRTCSALVVAWLAAGAAHAQPAPFTEEAAARGVSFVTPAGPSEARGVAFVDLDNDGFADLVVTGGASNVVGLWRNDGTGHFVNRSSGSGIAAFTASSGLVAGDYDADGDLDLYLSRTGQPNALLRNNGNFTFTNVASLARVTNFMNLTTGCAFGDYNADGHLDLYVSNIEFADARNYLYRNNADGTFTDVALDLGVGQAGYTWHSRFFDFDRDTRPDLYVSNDDGYDPPECSRRNYLFHNQGGVFADITFASGTAACVESMGIAIADFDANRLPDIYITNTFQGNELFLNQGDGTFTEAAGEHGLRSHAKGWGAAFFDFDNTGDLELYVCNADAPNRFYVRPPDPPPGDPTLVDLAQGLGVDIPGPNKQVVAVADIDHDGDLDMVVQAYEQPVRLFINHEGSRRNWVRFRVVGAPANLFAIGASVDVRVGDAWQTREVMGSGGFKSHDELTLHVGLGDAVQLDEILVRWPAGAAGSEKGVLTPGTRTLRNYPANQTWALYPDCLLGGADPVTGAFTSEDFFAFLECFFAAPKGAVTPGCELMDMDGDATLTTTDFFEFLRRFFE